MPQMAPMNWLLMSIIFITMLSISINKIYHMFFNNKILINKPKKTSIESEVYNMWKW